MRSEAELARVVQALDRLGFPLGPRQRRQQQRRQDGDDGDDHQQFNQGERVWAGRGRGRFSSSGHFRLVHTSGFTFVLAHHLGGGAVEAGAGSANNALDTGLRLRRFPECSSPR